MNKIQHNIKEMNVPIMPLKNLVGNVARHEMMQFAATFFTWRHENKVFFRLFMNLIKVSWDLTLWLFVGFLSFPSLLM